MDGIWIDNAALLIRWLHIIAAVAWIGASFYFVWLDNSLRKPTRKDLLDQGVDGELWAVHGGGFYNPQKYLVAPPSLPENLHWFYWESYTTWMSGFALFVILYLANPETYLIDPRVMPLSSLSAITFALGFLVAGWVVYDGICRLFSSKQKLIGFLTFLLVTSATLGATRIFSGRAAYLIVGAMMATIMSANVFFWIIPGQRKVIAAMRAGLPVDPVHGQRGKMRSVHNTYFTLPVIFCMLSNHYAQLYAHPYSGWILVFMMLGGVLIRQYFLDKHKGFIRYQYPLAGVVLIFFGLFVILPLGSGRSISEGREFEPSGQGASLDRESFAIVQKRCYGCHALSPTLIGGGAPKGIAFETPEDLDRYAALIYQQSVTLKVMPLGNITQMTDEERLVLAHWYGRRQTKDHGVESHLDR
jgi:uncharacterized membrane protein